MERHFDNINRNRYYGLRIGDIVQLDFTTPSLRGEIFEYGFMDNNRVYIKMEDGRETSWTAEWCKIIEKVEDRLAKNIGKKVKKCAITEKNTQKKEKKFKSGLYVNTIKGVINHPLLEIPAYTFEEDDSYVECRRCEIVS
ncbi:MAG: hypothetical protein EHM34_07210 [Nitrosopumilales archaeon]|nr:MAG: hypothetical protein EHM34_07210 [Nitrosopumilales archaeon]